RRWWSAPERRSSPWTFCARCAARCEAYAADGGGGESSPPPQSPQHPATSGRTLAQGGAVPVAWWLLSARRMGRAHGPRWDGVPLALGGGASRRRILPLGA